MKTNNLLFSTRSEIFHLGLPVILLLGIAAEFHFGKKLFSGLNKFQMAFLVDIIFLNVTHNVFTYLIIFSTKGMKPWLQAHGGSKSFGLKLITLNLCLFLAFFACVYFFAGKKYFVTGMIVLSALIPVHHGMSQSFGLSLLYAKKGLPKYSVNGERLWFNLFLATFMISAITTQIWSVQMHLAAIPTALIACTLIFYAAVSPSAVRRTRLIFSLRFLLWPLSLFSRTAVYSTQLLHGLEYGFVTNKLMSPAEKRQLLVFFAIGAVCLVGLFRLNGVIELRQGERVPVWMAVLTSLSIAFTYSHYYLDRKMFLMRHQINRETTGAALLN